MFAAKKEGRGCYASALLNSSAQIGTAVGLAVLFTLAAAHAEAIAGGEPTARRHSSRGTG
jgi:hypothetical protein